MTTTSLENMIEINNKKPVWFKKRKYILGWIPSVWQGWAILALYIFLVIFDLRFIQSSQSTMHGVLIKFIPRLIFLSIAFFFICYRRAEGASWRWGDK